MNAPRRASGNLNAIVTLMLILLVIGFGWRQCWYATPLSDAEMERYLADDAAESRIHKALSQVKERLDRHDPDAGRWFEAMARLARHETPQIRSTVAWTMGAAPEHEAFGPILLELLDDPELEVRHNAAVSLGARGEPRARPVLLAMLDELVLRAPVAGSLEQPRGQGETTRFGQILARIRDDGGRNVDLIAPVSGRLVRVTARHGARVAVGDELFAIGPGAGQVENALIALARIARPEDLAAMQRIAEGRFNLGDTTRALAQRLIEDLRARK
ncbi:MAG: HEAT repeat domain-containing protein [Planctomycetes bacterium]|nr:HEAT repeat domain-containing protein [Planctomycetota bacterium]